MVMVDLITLTTQFIRIQTANSYLVTSNLNYAMTTLIKLGIIVEHWRIGRVA